MSWGAARSGLHLTGMPSSLWGRSHGRSSGPAWRCSSEDGAPAVGVLGVFSAVGQPAVGGVGAVTFSAVGQPAVQGVGAVSFSAVHCLVFVTFLCLKKYIEWRLANSYLFSPFLFRLLYSLAFNARFLRHLWSLISSMTTQMITG